jgi:RNA polymerase sigma-70 factor (ECF subfamily)
MPYWTEIPATVLDAARNGDEAAYEAIYLAYRRPVHTLIRRLVSCRATAEDLFQEVFVEILRSLASFNGSGSFAGWVRSVAVNKCLMHLRSPWQRCRVWWNADGEEDARELLGAEHLEATRPDAVFAAQADLERALAALPPLTRAVVWLHDVEGYTHAEIAHLVRRTPSFSKSQLSRAHERLRELLEPTTETVTCTPVSTNC